MKHPILFEHTFIVYFQENCDEVKQQIIDALGEILPQEVTLVCFRTVKAFFTPFLWSIIHHSFLLLVPLVPRDQFVTV